MKIKKLSPKGVKKVYIIMCVSMLIIYITLGQLFDLMVEVDLISWSTSKLIARTVIAISLGTVVLSTTLPRYKIIKM